MEVAAMVEIINQYSDLLRNKVSHMHHVNNTSLTTSMKLQIYVIHLMSVENALGQPQRLMKQALKTVFLSKNMNIITHQK